MTPPVIVNSLICFIFNFRHHSDIRRLVKQYFAKSAVLDAQRVLQTHLSKLENLNLPDDLFDLFDLTSTKYPDLQFAAADLKTLPLVLPSNENDKVEILAELKSLRSFITDALEGKIDDMPRDSVTPSSVPKSNQSGSSPESPHNWDMSANENSSNSWPTSPPKLEYRYSDVKDGPSKGVKRKTGQTLDAAVKKLSQRRRAEVEKQESSSTCDWSCSVDPQTYLDMIRTIQTPPTNLLESMIDEMTRINGGYEKNDGNVFVVDYGDDSWPSPSEDIKEELRSTETSNENESDKPFVCGHSSCGKRFANKFLLKKHQFIHTGLRPHTCPFCNKRFNRKDNLLRHKKTHLQTGLGEELFRQKRLSDTISELFPTLTSSLVPITQTNVENLCEDSISSS